MTDTPHVIPPEEAPAVPAADVEALLGTMSKALRAFNMYQDNNPVFQRFNQGLRDAIASLWEHTDALELGVTEEGFRYAGETFALGQGRDSMAFAFYKDGVRTLKFLPGFEDEVAHFLDAVNRAMRSREQGADDLITVLWEEDFASLQYGYVDLLMEGLSVPDAPLELDLGALDAAAYGTDMQEAETNPVQGTSASSMLGGGLTRDDFDETLYFLDQAEMAALQTEVEVEMERDLKGDVLKALFDRLEEPGRPQRQTEILDILDQLMPLFLSRGDMGSAATVLDELDRLSGQDEAVGQTVQERIERLFARLSDPEVLEQFVQALEDGAVDPQSDEVNLFFSRLHAEALPVLIRFSELSQTSGVRGRLSSAIDGLAARHPGEVNELLRSDEAVLVLGAARVAGRVRLAQSVPTLHATLEHPDREVRMAVVEALVSIRLTPALQALTTALRDDDREVRVAAARALGAVRFASARDALAASLDDRRLKDADLTEKMAFYEAYGAIGGAAAVERFDQVLNGKGFLGRRSPTELRACAALGLGQAATAPARAALERAQKDDDPIVRNAVLRALRKEEGTTP